MNIAQVFVAIDADDKTKKVLGFYSLSMFSIPASEINLKWPKHSVPVVLLGILARDTSQKSKGLGDLLFIDACFRVTKACEIVACHAVFTNAKNEKAASFYMGYGMKPLKSNPLNLFLPIEKIKLLLTNQNSNIF